MRSIKMTPALHSSQLPDGSYGGDPAGFLVRLADQNIYFACDTALFSDMQLIGRMGISLAVLPIGDLFTMGPQEAAIAARMVKPKYIVPCHYGTFPVLPGTPDALIEELKKLKLDAEVVALRPGETLT